MFSLEKIKQRKVAQWAIAYVAAAWVVLQVCELVWGIYGWSPAVLRLLPVFLGIGLLATLVLVWFHGEKGNQRVSAVELLMLAGILAIAGGVLFIARGKRSEGVVDVANTGSPAVERGSIAVLPFADMSPAKDQAYFSDGLTEELLNVLAQIAELRVAARTSSFSFRDSKVSIDSIARALRVEYVLEGSVRKAGEDVRITAQLIKAGTGYHVWSKTYDRRLQDVFAVQDEISKAIVDALRLKISGGVGTLAQADTTDPETHALVLKGDYAANARSEASIAQAASLFQQAIDRDPDYARAWAGLATAQWLSAYRRFTSAVDGYVQAAKSAQHALELDSTNVQAHGVLGRIADIHEWDFKRAMQHFARAIELKPGFAEAYLLQAWLLMRLGQEEKSLASARHATLLDPVSPAAHNTLGSMYAYANQNAQALASYRTALALSPENPIVAANMALTFGTGGQPDSAITYGLRAGRLAPDDGFVAAALGYAYARAGRRAEAEAQLRKLASLKDESPYTLATVHAGLDNWDEAFKQLDRAVAEHDDLVPDVGVDDVFKPVRNDARMKRLLERIGLK